MVAAGMFDQQPMSVSWFHHGDLIGNFHGTEADATRMYTLVARHGSCAGGIGAACLSLEIVRRHLGARLADKAARILMVPESVRRSPVQPPSHEFQGVSNSHVKTALAMLDHCMMLPQPVAVLSNRMGLSARQIQRLFKQELGESPATVLNRLRMARARELLEQSDMPIIDVADCCGFSTQSRFASVFKQHVGTQPSAYRKSKRDDMLSE